MAPSPQESADASQFSTGETSVLRPLPGHEIVISGMSGIFPSSNSVKQYMENLYSEVDMVTKSDRWFLDHPESPPYLGAIEGLDKFDAQFFRVHYKQAITLEPTCRKLLEHAYSAIFDAGVNAVTLRGKKVGVFIGMATSESEKMVQYDTIQIDGFGITGTNKSMFSNRISYWLDAKGPSYAIDASCCSSAMSIEHAYRSLMTNQCESAIVGGCSYCLQPFIQLSMNRIGFLSSDGVTKCFDKQGDGYARADTVSVLFIQKAKDAKRIYSEIYHAKTCFQDFTENYMPVRDPLVLSKFLNEFYKEINVDPAEVEYVEANATGILDVDRAELQAISQVFKKTKDNPLLLGSVKSNIGNSEAATGACAVTKLCLAYHKGEISANLHYENPIDDVEAIMDGRMQVVCKKTPFNKGFTAVNNFSYTGINVHLLLKGHYKAKNLDRYKCDLPYLITASGRQESCVSHLLTDISSNPLDQESISLLHHVYSDDVSGHTCRGYSIVSSDENNETVTLSQSIEYISGANCPVWFVYSGMGSQWPGMGKELLKIPIFAKTIERCRKVLEPKGIDLIYILTEPDKTIYDNILNSFVGIAAVQLGLTDVLKELGIVPDNIIGHSVGELGCAYADGCFTVEEMILSAYSRGLVSVQTPFITGSMAAIGIGYKTILPMLPAGIEVACHNSSESSTISGPADIMKEFVADLTSRGIFAREVPCSNIAYHSKYIADAGPELLKYLKEVIKDPKPRSDKWLSTSVPQDKWQDSIAKHSSAEYHTNNLLNSVLFEETSKMIPSNAILIEVAPHGLLQAILKRSMPESCIHVPLTRRGHSDPIKLLLESIGLLYQQGLNPKVSVLYPKVEFPVSTDTPLLSHIVQWEHSETWPIPSHAKKLKVKSASRQFIITIHDEENKYLQDHIRNGFNIYPEAAILVRVWETLGLHLGTSYQDMSVNFQNVQFHGEVVLKQDIPLILNVEIQKGCHYFEVASEGISIASGFVYDTKSVDRAEYEEEIENDDKVNLTTKDIYKLFQLKGYSYRDNFQTIVSSNITCNKALLKWNNKWTSLIDSLIQLKIIRQNHNGVSRPKYLQELNIDIEKHNSENILEQADGTKCFAAHVYDTYSTIRCAGVDIVGMRLVDEPLVQNVAENMVKQEFVPNFPIGTFSFEVALNINLQIIIENALTDNVQIVELASHTPSILPNFQNIVKVLPFKNFNFDLKTIDTTSFEKAIGVLQPNVIIVNGLLRNQNMLSYFYNNLQNNQFILSRESSNFAITPNNLFALITLLNIGEEKLVLLKKSNSKEDDRVFVQINHDPKHSWLTKATKDLRDGKSLVLVSEIQANYGLRGIFKTLREQFKNKVSLFVIEDKNAPSFNPNNAVYKEQLDKQLTVNILKKGHWGGYYYLSTTESINLRDVALTIKVPGDLDTLSWEENSLKRSQSNVVQVHYAGLSLRDVAKANGRIIETDTTNENIYGMDFSGINSRGQRVMGIIKGGSVSTTVESDPDLLWPVPEHWSLEDAATVPLAYIQAFYCLLIRSQLFSESTVLVHGGAGALGQACIAVALAYNCTVYATVSTNKKKRLLQKLFPELKDNQIGNSRDNSFEDLIMSQTNGGGCHFIISCLEGMLQKATIRCGAIRGKVLMLSHREMVANGVIGMGSLLQEQACVSVCVSSIFKPEHTELRKLLQRVVGEGIATGLVRPLTRIIYAPSEISRAFRLVAASKQCGRVLVNVQGSIIPTTMNSLPRLSLDPNKSHVVVCDDMNLGIELADRLVQRGARKLLLHLNPELANGYLYLKMVSWQKNGVSVVIASEDLRTAKGCVNTLQAACQLGGVEGIYITLSSQDAAPPPTSNQIETARVNADAVVLNLDTGSRQLCYDLKYFVVLVADDHLAVDTIMDEICQKRADDGLPALSLHFDSLTEVDVNVDNVTFADIKPQKIFSVLNTIEASLRHNHHVAVSNNAANNNSLNFSQKIAKILGVKDLNELASNLQLEQIVGVDNINTDEIINVIKYEFNEIYTKEKLEQLTIAELNDIPSTILKLKQVEKLSGLSAFIKFVDADEYQATDPIVQMHTKLSNMCDMVDEMDHKGTYLMMIPGYEGHHHIFHQLSDRLKIQAITLQLEPNYIEETLMDTATRIFKTIRKRFEFPSKFYLLGYSFGVTLALEIAAMFEKEGLTGTVFCLDSSPDVQKAQLEMYLGDLEQNKLENMIIEHMFTLLNGSDLDQLQQDLTRLNNWSDKVEACLFRLRNWNTHSIQYLQYLIEKIYRRINQAITYKSELEPLKSQLVLLRSRYHDNGLPEDYGLSKYSQQPVKIYSLSQEHVLAFQDLRCSSVINSALDEDVLEEFRQKFTCEIYSADAENLF